MKRLARLLLLVGICATAAAAVDNTHRVADSKHNLSISGTGEVRSPSEADICIFCHTPHRASSEGPLWNHEMPVVAYTPYTSSTLKATVGQPTGASKLCLSCHDGTVALGAVRSRSSPIPMRQGAVIPAGRSRIGTDLSGHHPISFVYDSALTTAKGELRDPMALQRDVRLDKAQQLQCTSCHDPHFNQYGKFLVMENRASALCLECHVLNGWNTSAHATSTATWNGSGPNPWPHTERRTVADNGCENCHTSHAAGVKPHLLVQAKPEDNCLICHNGSVAAVNLAAEFSKTSAHPVSGDTMRRNRTGVTGLTATAEPTIFCLNCHDPHATAGAGAPVATASTRAVRVPGGVVASAAGTSPSDLCFRCHASSAAVSHSKIARQISQPNTRLQFDPGNVSFHPVLSSVRSTQDRSLLPPWTHAQRMACIDCHNNDQGPGARGTGPNGPHGSIHPPLLERNLNMVDYQPESATAYALCYKCHSRTVLLADRLHAQHVRDQQTACSTCHDAHGSSQQTSLINFNTIYAQPLGGRSGGQQIRYTDMGGGRVSCTLTCHGEDHDNKFY